MDRERELVAWAAEIGAQVGEHSTRHDRDGTFVTEAYDVLRASGRAAVGDLALEVGAGAACYRTQPIERCVRDVRGAKYHPLTPDESLVHAGGVSPLGRPADER
ncbi:MAG: acyl-CoA dehydrogenase [Acidimicrobiales bacterium]|nr:acyl-CoA dehydrogenase [Acidimicrobiales bacterium]